MKFIFLLSFTFSTHINAIINGYIYTYTTLNYFLGDNKSFCRDHIFIFFQLIAKHVWSGESGSHLSV